MITHQIQTLKAFLNVRLQAGAGLSHADVEQVGKMLGDIHDDAKVLETKYANVVPIKPYLSQREAEKWCEEQGLITPPPRGPDGPGGAA